MIFITESYLDALLTVGSENPSHKKTETFRFDTMTWTFLSDYPFGKILTSY